MERQETGGEALFCVGEIVVHPAHGVGAIVAIERRDIGGRATPLYVMKITTTGMKVMVAIESAKAVGLRPLMNGSVAAQVIDVLASPEVAVDVEPWSRRHRLYTEMVNSGSPFEIAKVLRDMHRLKAEKDLSFGERRLLDQAKALLYGELALVKNMKLVDLERELVALLDRPIPTEGVFSNKPSRPGAHRRPVTNTNLAG